MDFIAFRVFNAESHRLKQLSLIAPFSFGSTRDAMLTTVRNGHLRMDQSISIGASRDETILVRDFVRRLSAQAGRYQRELLFIRLISALEVFLIDIIQEIASGAPDLFKPTEMITMARSELFRFQNMRSLLQHIISQDCRTLSSGGFGEITKYYNNKMGIDYRSLGPGINCLQEYHDRRHLLVHKLGQTDEKYRHKYSTTAKKLTVDTEYLSNAITDAVNFADQLNALVMQRTFGIGTNLEKKYRVVCVLIYHGDMPAELRPTYSISITGAPVLLSSITLNRIDDENRIRLALEGEQAQVRGYIGILHSHHTNGKIRIDYINPKKLRP